MKAGSRGRRLRLAQALGRVALGLGAGAILGGCGTAGTTPAPSQTIARSASQPAVRPEILSARFAAHQRLAQPARLVIVVRNPGQQPIPDVAVTITNPRYGTSVQPFATYLNMPGVEGHSRPVWVVDRPPGPCGFSCRASGPGAGVTPETHTWALGHLGPGAQTTFSWALTPVMAGHFEVHYAVTPSLNSGPSSAPSGQPWPSGTFHVLIVPTPQHETVSDSGAIVKAG